MNPTKTLSQFVAGSHYDEFDDSVVEAAKVAILDGVANMLAGSTQLLASIVCLLYTSPSPRDGLLSRMPSSA